jgi:hypothetical protein
VKKLILCALLAGASIQAAPIVLADGELNENVTLDGSQASRTWDVGSGITMTVQAFSLFGSTFNAANTTQFGSNLGSEAANTANLGLGVCGTTELCFFNEWQVDNTTPGGRDFVLFSFSAPVDIGSVVIRQTTITADSDAGYASGNGQTLNQLLLSLVANSGPALNPGQSRSVNVGAANVTQLLFGTLGTDLDDFFKLYSIDVTASVIPPPPVSEAPEPASMAMLGAGLLGLGLVARRRK